MSRWRAAMASAVAGAGCLSDMIAMQHSTHHRRSLNSKVFFTEVGPDLIDLDHWGLACLTHSIYERSRHRELPSRPTAVKIKSVMLSDLHQALKEEETLMKVKQMMHKGVEWVSPDTPITTIAKR
jgi:hypothetical protein